MSTYTFWCLIDGDKTVFDVVIPINSNISALKKVIKEAGKNSVLSSVDVKDLTLWKIDVDPRDQAIKQQINAGQYQPLPLPAEPLDPMDLISAIWPEQPPNNRLQVFISVPIDLSPVKPVDPIPSKFCLRSETVSALYEKIKEHHFILVRGTPASGKSTLITLLANHIRQQEPAVHVISLFGWAPGNGGWKKFLPAQGWVQDKKTVFIFDEAQLSYRDFELWGGFIKEIAARVYEDRFAIAFASYGSPGSRIPLQNGTPIFLADSQRVSLRPVDHGDGLGAVGLLFTQTEFDDLVRKRYSSSEYYFDSSFFESVFGLTGGHVGAIVDFVDTITGLDSYRLLKRTAPGQLYTWDSFRKNVDLRDFMNQLATSARIFMRGLPLFEDLKTVSTADVLYEVLRKNSISRSHYGVVDAELNKCFNNGWLHADKNPLGEGIIFTFPSPLHRWFVEWKLRDTRAQGVKQDFFDWQDSVHPIEAKTILEFALKVISGFSPRSLSAERGIGPGVIQRPPEAQYQDEFYRSSIEYSKGSLLTFPEYGTAKGRVDFYIPSKRWGVELLRDGDRLKEHSDRFSESGVYGTTLGLSDYIILDFRTTRPIRPHPKLKKLYHVIISNGCQINTLDHSLKAVDGGKIRLLFG